MTQLLQLRYPRDTRIRCRLRMNCVHLQPQQTEQKALCKCHLHFVYKRVGFRNETAAATTIFANFLYDSQMETYTRYILQVIIRLGPDALRAHE